MERLCGSKLCSSNAAYPNCRADSFCTQTFPNYPSRPTASFGYLVRNRAILKDPSNFARAAQGQATSCRRISQSMFNRSPDMFVAHLSLIA